MSPSRDWLVVGISGVTCGGKTTFASALKDLFPDAPVIHQDVYFLPVDDSRHTHVPSLNHINWEIATALDMDKMRHDIEQVLSREPSEVRLPLLIIEGFLIFTDPLISSRCKHKLFFTLTMEEFWARRSVRTYEPADVPGYFDLVVWPEYEREPSEVRLPLLIIEGFLIFTDPLISSRCKHKLFFTLTKEECWARRSVRTYEPADVPGYFDLVVWPEYERHLDLAVSLNADLSLVHGTRDIDSLAREVKETLDNELNCEHS